MNPSGVIVLLCVWAAVPVATHRTMSQDIETEWDAAPTSTYSHHWSSLFESTERDWCEAVDSTDSVMAVDPSNFVLACDLKAPTRGPVWSTGSPSIEMRRIFCGEILNGEALGFHGWSNWLKSAKVNFDYCTHSIYTCESDSECLFYEAHNMYCRHVWIYNSRTNRWQEKRGGSTLWPHYYGPKELVPYIQSWYNFCRPPSGGVTVCLKSCTWPSWVNPSNHSFDVVLETDQWSRVLSAYPTQVGTCDNNPEWRTCQCR